MLIFLNIDGSITKAEAPSAHLSIPVHSQKDPTSCYHYSPAAKQCQTPLWLALRLQCSKCVFLNLQEEEEAKRRQQDMAAGPSKPRKNKKKAKSSKKKRARSSDEL